MRGMTSYAHVKQKGAGGALEVTLRSTNSRYLEMFTHQLPPEKIFLEEAIKKEIQKQIKRGRIEVYFCFYRKSRQELFIDKHVVEQYYVQTKAIAKSLSVPHENFLRNMMMLPGVMSLQETQSIDNTMILRAVREGLRRLVGFKKREGNLIKKEIAGSLGALEQQIQQIKNGIAIQPDKAVNGKDIAEEMALMSFYAKKMKKIVFSQKEQAQGKALDFLTQEVLRELNAASSKIKAKKISWHLVEAKRFLDRIREQAQNIE